MGLTGITNNMWVYDDPRCLVDMTKAQLDKIMDFVKRDQERTCRMGASIEKRTYNVEVWTQKVSGEDEGPEFIEERLLAVSLFRTSPPTREDVLFEYHKAIEVAGFTPREVEVRVCDPFRG